jgi:hemoglobin
MMPGEIPVKPAGAAQPWGDADTPYEALGGDVSVRSLVDAFYDVIEEESPVLRDMLPRNTSGSRQKLYEYMSGWLGGPPLYTSKRGHPRLRMRHMPFAIGRSEADEWMRCMRVAMDRTGVEGPLRDFLDSKLEPLALHMVNRQ